MTLDDRGFSIEVKPDDSGLLREIAEAEYRTPEQQAAAFVHQVLAQHRARANAPERPTGQKRGPRGQNAAG